MVSICARNFCREKEILAICHGKRHHNLGTAKTDATNLEEELLPTHSPRKRIASTWHQPTKSSPGDSAFKGGVNKSETLKKQTPQCASEFTEMTNIEMTCRHVDLGANLPRGRGFDEAEITSEKKCASHWKMGRHPFSERRSAKALLQDRQ